MVQKLPQIERFCDAPSVQLYRASVMLKEIRYCVTEKINQSWLDMASPPPVFLMTSVTMPLPAPDVPGAPWLPWDHWPLGTLCCCHLLRCICQHWADSSGASQGPDWLKIGSRSPDVRQWPVRARRWLDLTTSNYGSCEERIGTPQKHQLWTFLIPTSFMFIIPCCGHVSNLRWCHTAHWWVLFGFWN